MIHPYAAAGFLLAVLPLVATPGASLTLLIQHVSADGRRQALPVVLGTVTGLYAHAILALAGLSALVMHSSRAFAVVKLAGAAYLVGLGVWTWWTAARPRSPVQEKRIGSVYSQALLANVLNPKAASVYLTLVPQFVRPGDPFAGQILALATVHALLIAVWLAVWTALLHRGAHLVRRDSFRRVIGRVAGVVLVVLGIRAARA